MFWYLVACKPKQEKRAKENLINQSVNAFLPLIKVESCTPKNQVVLKEEALFPGYLFVQLRENDAIWGKMRSTRGVRDFVRFGGKPAMVPEAIVKNIRESEIEIGQKVLSKLPQSGDSVLIKDGPFQDLQGIFKIRDGTKRAVILLNILGKNQRLSIDLNNIVRL